MCCGSQQRLCDPNMPLLRSPAFSLPGPACHNPSPFKAPRCFGNTAAGPVHDPSHLHPPQPPPQAQAMSVSCLSSPGPFYLLSLSLRKLFPKFSPYDGSLYVPGVQRHCHLLPDASLTPLQLCPVHQLTSPPSLNLPFKRTTSLHSTVDRSSRLLRS